MFEHNLLQGQLSRLQKILLSRLRHSVPHPVTGAHLQTVHSLHGMHWGVPLAASTCSRYTWGLLALPKSCWKAWRAPFPPLLVLCAFGGCTESTLVSVLRNKIIETKQRAQTTYIVVLLPSLQLALLVAALALATPCLHATCWTGASALLPLQYRKCSETKDKQVVAGTYSDIAGGWLFRLLLPAVEGCDGTLPCHAVSGFKMCSITC